MLFLKFRERKALTKVMRRPRDFMQYQRANALLEMAKGRPSIIVALKVSISKDRLDSWVRDFELRRIRRLRFRLAYLEEIPRRAAESGKRD